MTQQLQRKIGCFLGLAIGDALGTTLTLFDRRNCTKITDIVGIGPFNLPAGAWTDDTAMAYAMADSIIRSRGFNDLEIMESWCRWLENGEYSSTGVAIDIGKTIFRSLMNYKRTGELYGFKDERAAGNGAIMRIAPVIIAFLNNNQILNDAVNRQTQLTHPSTIANEASILMSNVLRRAILGYDKSELLFSDYNYQTIVRSIAYGEFKSKSINQISSGGYVFETLEASLWSFYNTKTFEDALLTATHLCGDPDTVGAVTGQIAGAFYGKSSIPPRWLNVLHKADEIEGLCLKLDKII